jgi:hypothetical protein
MVEAICMIYLYVALFAAKASLLPVVCTFRGLDARRTMDAFSTGFSTSPDLSATSQDSAAGS